VTEDELSRLPVVRAPFAYEGREKRFAYLGPDYAIDDVLYQHPEVFRNRGRVYRATSRGGCSVEVGAHIGTTTVFAADFFRKHYAFEPSSRNFQILNRNLSLNHASNVFPERLALSDFKGESDLFLCPDPKSVCHSLNRFSAVQSRRSRWEHQLSGLRRLREQLLARQRRGPD